MLEQRIDKALSNHPDIGSRSQASRLLQRQLVKVNGVEPKSSYIVREGDQLVVNIPETPKHVLVPYDFPIQIVYEDDDLLVVEKPAGLVVHPAYGHAQDTLVNALLYALADRPIGLSQGFHELRPGLVHRLDKDTSGLIVIARNEHAQRFLSLQFQRRLTHRIYRAVVFGTPKAATGTWTSHLKRHPEDRRRSVSDPSNGKLAITHYRVLATHPAGLSLLELKLETGRTHQIRVHVTEAGHPIIGDTLYGADRRLKSLKSVKLRQQIGELPRFALHAFELGFRHPHVNDALFLRFRSPWPADLRPLIEHLQWPMFDSQHMIDRWTSQDDPTLDSHSLAAKLSDYNWPKLQNLRAPIEEDHDDSDE
ncbi:MAG TPA: RluA family pseudouridine synthase [Pseudobdellovibrionaceae bacterium]|nr:RluA family pseudouridine synthase [Pseudobdellovibrionaceae bacterium]